MPTLTADAWAQIRHDYEHTDRPVEDICAEHGISSGTLRDRVRRWNWTRRRQPIPEIGPPSVPAPSTAPSPTASSPTVPSTAAPSPAASSLIAPSLIAPSWATSSSAASYEVPAAPLDVTPAAISRRLQGAVARVLPAIETTLATLAARSAHPREMERGARALAALTRTLRELNALLRQHPVPDDDGPSNLDEFRQRLMRKMDAIIAARPKRDAEPAADVSAMTAVKRD